MERIKTKTVETEVAYKCGHIKKELLGSTEADKKAWIELAATIPCRVCAIGK
jgi:hypothetical protein